MRAIHADYAGVDDRDTIIKIALAVGLDIQRFRSNLQDQACLDRLRQDHESGVDLNVFGAPTFVFPEAEPAYLKLTRTLDDQESLDCWRSVATTIATRSYVMEMKRPQ